jgi:ribosomal protein S18 acetylase RimI-like enzyme
MEPEIEIRVAAPRDVDQIGELFDLYRQFYAQPADPELARAFISERVAKRESVILVACRRPSRLLGFAQLYPTFCSVSAARIYILYDLFVSPESRRTGIGQALLRAVADHAARAHAVRVELATAKTNRAAQTLYQSLGWVRDDVFDRYSLSVAL